MVSVPQSACNSWDIVSQTTSTPRSGPLLHQGHLQYHGATIPIKEQNLCSGALNGNDFANPSIKGKERTNFFLG